MVRSHLDYAVAVWYPYKIKHKIAIENVQRRATKELPSIRDLSYIENNIKIFDSEDLIMEDSTGSCDQNHHKVS